MRYWVAYRECGCVLAVAPETASMIPQGADCEFVRLAVARGLKTRLTAEGEQAPTVGPCPKHRADCPDCGGHGWYQSEFRSDAGDTCRTCNGTGIIATASAEPLAARQEEKTGNEAAETKGASPEAGVEYEVKYYWEEPFGLSPPEGPHVHSGTLEELDQQLGNGDLVIASQEEQWTYPLIAPPSGAGESERREMAIEPTIVAKTVFEQDGKPVTSIGKDGELIVLERSFISREDAAASLRALADALDGGPKRRQRKAKDEQCK